MRQLHPGLRPRGRSQEPQKSSLKVRCPDERCPDKNKGEARGRMRNPGIPKRIESRGQLLA